MRALLLVPDGSAVNRDEGRTRCAIEVRFYARSTLPAFMQLVQTFALRTRPFSSRMVTFWMLGRNMRLVTRWEWLTLRPKDGALPQTSQIFDIILNSVYVPVKNR